MTDPRSDERRVSFVRTVAERAGSPRSIASKRRLVHHVGGAPDRLADVAVLTALRQLLPSARIEAVRPSVRPLPNTVRTGSLTRVRGSHLLVAGGTVIGHPAWSRALLSTLTLTRARPLLMLGAGVDDQITPDRSTEEDARRWAVLLRRFESVTVRGPRSAERLAEIGIPSRVVGEPALVLTAPNAPRLDTGCVGLAIGQTPEGTGQAEATIGREVAKAAVGLLRDGLEVRLLVTAEADRRQAMACAAHIRLSAGPVEVVDALEPDAFFAAVDGCSVVLGQRLPALVLAAAAGIPVVAVGDRPEVQDFMRSLKRDDRRHDLATLDADDLLDRLQAEVIAARFDAHRQTDAVDHLRRALHREAGRIATVLDLPDEP